MRQNLKFFKQSVASLILIPTSFFAQAMEPAPIPVGEVDVYPTISITTGSDDNILSTENNEQSSWITRINPNLLIETETETTLLQLNYGFKRGVIHNSTQNNYLDHNLNGVIKTAINSRNRVDIKANIIKGHDARGEEVGGATTNTDKPLEFDLNSIQSIYTYGREGAKGRIELRAAYQDKKYTNFRTITESRDYDQTDLSAAFRYRMTEKTHAVATIRQSKIDYDNSNKDSTTMKYLLGATWEATAKTSGKINVGWSDKNFKESALANASGGTWEAEINWNPKTYSNFIFSTGQEFGESNTVDSHIDTQSYNIDWQHFWKDHIKVECHTQSLDRRL